MLLIKLTALIMGMVMALTGMNNAFPQSSLLPEQGKRPAQAACLPRPRGAVERAALLPVMLVEEPIARPAQTGFDIMRRKPTASMFPGNGPQARGLTAYPGESGFPIPMRCFLWMCGRQCRKRAPLPRIGRIRRKPWNNPQKRCLEIIWKP